VRHLHVERLSRVQEQIKGLLCQYFLYLLMTPEVGGVDYESY
jgi:hypothetical protein